MRHLKLLTFLQAGNMAEVLNQAEEENSPGDRWSYLVIPNGKHWTVQAIDEEGYPCGAF